MLSEGARTKLLTTRNRLEGGWLLGQKVRLIGVGGYHHTTLQDRAGPLEAYEIGAGLGSPVRREPVRVD